MGFRFGQAFFHAVLIWIVPFVSAFAFFTPEGKIHKDVNPFFFKAVMVIVGMSTGCFCAVRYFKDHHVSKGD
jgi:hypothetical protein